MFRSRYWQDLTSPELGIADMSQAIAVLPVAAIEQHGPHLPVSVDTTIIEGLVHRIVARLPSSSSALFLPTLPIGKSNEHSRFPGTLTLSAETLCRLWMEVGASVARAGVRKLVLFNSHGGQINAMDIVARDLREQQGMLVVKCSWFDLGLPPALFTPNELKFGIHGGDVETSMMLALRPDLVHMARAKHFVTLAERSAAQFPFIASGDGVRFGWQTQDLNEDGACGDATQASAAKGEQVIAHVAERFIAMLGELDRLPLATLRPGPLG